MYTAYFGLKDKPFSITPDPSYLYMSPHHQEALAHLLYGIGENGGFVQLTGEVGTGKTTLIRTLMEQRIENVDVALCLNPQLTVEELVATVCDELHVNYPKHKPTLKPLVDALNQHLLHTHAQGRRTVLIIDEAQNLSHQVLEQVRLLTNLETHRHKLLRIILVAQPELQRLLAHPDMRQLAQRITARYHLTPLNHQQTGAYILHRIKVAGGSDDLFTAGALKAAHRLSRGVPRLINAICDRALLGAYVQGLKRVNSFTLRRAAREALQPSAADRSTGSGSWPTWIVSGIMGAILGLYLFYLYLTPTAGESSLNVENAHATVTSTPQVIQPTLTTPAAVPMKPLDIMALARQTDARVSLLAAWGETTPPGTALCEQIKKRRLRCLSGQGDWEELRRYNRPAILQLISAEGDSGQILLRALDQDIAILDAGGDPIRIATNELSTLWTGDYLIVWRLQTSQSLIRPGSQGESVQWLRRRLALAEGRELPQEPPSDTFDSELMERIRRFQALHNLEVDGLVGARTMLLLNQLAATPGTPLLNSPPAAP